MNPYKYINSFGKFGAKGGYKPGLKRINALLAAFDHPETRMKTIHLAGSNGKGSTIAFLKSIYSEAGYRVGVYTSPHLLEFNERIEINGEKIKTKELIELIKLVKPVVERVSNTELGEPSFFELVTTLAFLYFYRQEVDILILEVGLGGRLDATNIIKKPLISVITGISLEHTSILGDTIEAVTREKAGIIKNGVPVVTGVRNKSALREIKMITDRKASALVNTSEKYDYIIQESTLEGQRFSLLCRELYFKGKGESRGSLITPRKNSVSNSDYRIRLLGEFQIRNAITAIEVVQQLNSKFNVKNEVLGRGLKKADIPGRMEVLRRKPLFILDGSHNSEGIEMCISFLQELKKKNSKYNARVFIILAVFADKDIDTILNEISLLDNLKLIITKNRNERALETRTIKEKAEHLDLDNEIILPLEKAVKAAENKAAENDIISVIGSLYNIAVVKRALSIIE